MAYSTGILRQRVTILNRRETASSKWGKDGSGIEWEDAGEVWANVEWAKGKRAMNAGALDVYGVILVRMRYNYIASERSRIVYDGRTYQVLGDTFHASYYENTIQFHAQLVINE